MQAYLAAASQDGLMMDREIGVVFKRIPSKSLLDRLAHGYIISAFSDEK